MTFTARGSTFPRTLHVSTDAGTLTFSLEGVENYSFDGEGRLVGAWREARTYRRALDNRVLAKWIEPGPGVRGVRRNRRFLEVDERRTLLEDCRARAAEVAHALERGELSIPRHAAAELELALEWLGRVQAWDGPALEGEAARFASIYRPIPILPPDQYLSIVIQATEGCSYNECTFCTFYRDRPFRIKDVASLREHTEQVMAFLGRGRTLRRGVFLADANAVIIPQSRLTPLLDQLNEQLPIAQGDARSSRPEHWRPEHWRADGIYAFVSAPDALRKNQTDFAALRERNLRRVYVGLETGHDPLRRFLRKEGVAAEVLEAVRTIKGGGVAVGLIAMVGIGGEAFRAAHARDTAALIDQMPLGAGDLVYLSPFVSDGETEYDRDIAAAGIAPLDEEALVIEEARLKSALEPFARRTGVKVSHYDVREFVY